MITASSLSRRMNCPGSSVLPQAENHSEWAESGHEEHEELAIGVSASTLPPELAKYVPADARPEVALAFDVATGEGRVIGENLGRNYGNPGPFEIVGSTDVLGIEGDAVIVIDWKTGFLNVEPAATNPQLAFYALAAARALNKSRAIVRIIYTKSGYCDEHELDALDLASFAERLKALHLRAARAQETKNRGEQVSTREGAWCRHCASKSVCPSKVSLLVQIAEGGLAVIGDTAMTPERAAGAYEQIVRIEQLVKDARARLVTYVDEQGPIDLGDGRMYGRYNKAGTERLDGKKAIEAIRAVVSPEIAKDFESIAIDHSTSKAAISRAAKEYAEKRGAGKLANAVIEKIRELGGATHGASTMPIGEYTRGKDEPATRAAIDTDAVNRMLEGAS